MLIYPFVTQVFPKVKKELKKWELKAKDIKEERLQTQALESIEKKEFHCLGGSIYLLYPGVDEEFIKFVVAFQTISDYLDNLVDNTGIEDEQSFAQLHLAFQDALIPGQFSDYYRYYPYKKDNGYLYALVGTCQKIIAQLPKYDLIKDKLLFLAKQYSVLQTYKHLNRAKREDKLKQWINSFHHDYYLLTPWELAAATGSTLGIFSLCAAAYDDELSLLDIQNIMDAYFPWICSLHILLDYLIDLEEDRTTHQFNFIEHYESGEIAEKRLLKILGEAYSMVKKLKYPSFHRTVIDGLLAMYLSDSKGKISLRFFSPAQKVTQHAGKALLKKGGMKVCTLYWLCKVLRKSNIL